MKHFRKTTLHKMPVYPISESRPYKLKNRYLMHLTYRTGNLQDKDDSSGPGYSVLWQHQHAMTPENWNKYNSFYVSPDTFTYLMEVPPVSFAKQTKRSLEWHSWFHTDIQLTCSKSTELYQNGWCTSRFRRSWYCRKLTQMCISYAIETNESL